MTVRLEELLAAASSQAVTVQQNEERILAVRELAHLARRNAERDRLLIDMGAALEEVAMAKAVAGVSSNAEYALLARLDRLGKDQTA